jgi:hypothetical protein
MPSSFSLFLIAALVGTCLGLAGQIGTFNYASAYPHGCRPGMEGLYAAPSYSLRTGNTAYLCISLNGKVTSIFNVVVDQYSAISLTGSELWFWRGEGEGGGKLLTRRGVGK